MHYKQIASRIRGISCPFFGVSWEPPQADIDVAQKVITFLEDRRVLFNPYELEVADHCVQSVLRIREFLTEILCDLPNTDGLPQHLRMMRAACRKFLDADQRSDHAQSGRRIDMFHGGPDVWAFATALGELRSTIGLHIAMLAVMHGLGVEGDLAGVLPPAPEDDDDN